MHELKSGNFRFGEWSIDSIGHAPCAVGGPFYSATYIQDIIQMIVDQYNKSL